MIFAWGGGARCTGEARLPFDKVRQATVTSCWGVRNGGTTMYIDVYVPFYAVWSPR